MESSSSGGGLARRRSSGGWGSFSGDTDPFDIPAKGAPLERLRKWRQAALVLNASRRFRYTLDLKKEEQNEEIRRKIRAKAYVITAAFRFKEAGRVHVRSEETKVPIADGALGFGIKEDEITALTRDHNYSGLQQYGGVSGVAHMLKTDSEKGISGDDSDLIARKNTFGSNTYPRKKGRSFLAFVWDACKDLTLIILMVAAAVSLALGITTEGIKEGWYDGASIAFAVLLVVFVTAISDYKQSLQFQNLNEEKQNIRLEVVRGGRRITVSIYDLVVGDVVPLKIGDQVPADGILINGHSLSIDESSMTGESKIVHKDQKSPFLMSGCKVADGYGTMLVTAVGVNTEWGLLMASISEDSGEETPLQVRLNGVATFIGMVGLSVALAVLVVLLARYFTGHTYNPDGSVQYVKGKMGVGQTIRGVVRIFTVAVTIVVVAVPEGLPLAVTLTLAFSMRKMMKDKALVRRLSACETMGSATTICSDKTGTLTLNQMTVVEAYFGGKKMDSPDNAQMLSADVTSLIVEGIAQNTSGSIFEPEGGQEPEVTGSPTEKAILSWGLKLGMKFNETRLKSSILHVFPFNSEKKRGGVAVHLDPCRPGVRDSVRLCQAAGIKVRMVTGDNLQTARAIALECGILDDPNVLEPVIIEGKAFRVLSDLEREEAAEKISVMGRSSPNDKLLLVKALRARGHVVAVTGDGTNDAPALHEVVRWGRSVYANIQKFIQFQLTVNVAALIINVVAAVSSGNVPLNAVQLLWVNLIMDTLGALALATEPPTNHLMERPPVGRREPLITNIMWRNLIIMALFQVSVLLTLNFKGISLLQLKNDDPAHADKVKNTFIFNTFVLCQVFNEFNSRKPDELNIFKGISGNHLFIGIIAITVVLQALIVEFLGKFASTVRLSWQLWLVSIGLAFFGWPLAFVGKLIPVPKRPLGEFFACCCICKGSKQAPDDATSNDKEDNKPEP
ncbi:Calcium-transporting ATPase 9 plasma membrane-type [Zea mays]|uniref:P-type Ca(2+) transporter n=1 Tax=Zea mays TaxID=4577 RepID=A0A1D6E0B5_MAIZE|nr:Calcium-transporting ATPase 9 plasma membrane-type [Zea mays]